MFIGLYPLTLTFVDYSSSSIIFSFVLCVLLLLWVPWPSANFGSQHLHGSRNANLHQTVLQCMALILFSLILVSSSLQCCIIPLYNIKLKYVIVHNIEFSNTPLILPRKKSPASRWNYFSMRSSLHSPSTKTITAGSPLKGCQRPTFPETLYYFIIFVESSAYQTTFPNSSESIGCLNCSHRFLY